MQCAPSLAAGSPDTPGACDMTRLAARSKDRHFFSLCCRCALYLDRECAPWEGSSRACCCVLLTGSRPPRGKPPGRPARTDAAGERRTAPRAPWHFRAVGRGRLGDRRIAGFESSGQIGHALPRGILEHAPPSRRAARERARTCAERRRERARVNLGRLGLVKHVLPSDALSEAHTRANRHSLHKHTHTRHARAPPSSLLYISSQHPLPALANTGKGGHPPPPA